MSRGRLSGPVIVSLAARAWSKTEVCGSFHACSLWQRMAVMRPSSRPNAQSISTAFNPWTERAA